MSTRRPTLTSSKLTFSAIAIVASAAVLAGQTASYLPPVLLASPVRLAPVLDGRLEDAAWSASRPITMTARGVTQAARGSSCSVVVRAAYDDAHIYLAATWGDETRNDQGHRSWQWDAFQGAYVEGQDREDMLGVAFEHTGALVANMLAGVDANWDVWHWMAFRTNPQGYAMDRMHLLMTAEPGGRSRANRYQTPDGRDTWISRPEDAGDSLTVDRPAPATFAGDRVARFTPGRPTGSAADVRAKGEWADSNWTVEFSRKLDTGHDDDTRLSPTRNYRMALSVHDRTSGMDKSTGVMVLRFRGRVTKP